MQGMPTIPKLCALVLLKSTRFSMTKYDIVQNINVENAIFKDS